jgi:hypothetical protein
MHLINAKLLLQQQVLNLYKRRFTALQIMRLLNDVNPSRFKLTKTVRYIFFKQTQTTQSLVNLQQNRSRSESPFTNNGQIIAANRPGPPNSARSSSQSVGRTYFRQHLFNNIFRAKCSNAFTAVGIMDHPFDHFVTEAPVKVNEIIGKCFTLKEDQTKF